MVDIWLLQGMVPRSELLAAQSLAKANKDDADAKAKDLAWLEEQMKKAQEQLSAARQEAASLRAEAGGMVPRSDLEAAKLQLHELEKAARLEQKKQREELQALNDRLSAIDTEKASHANKMQVCWSASTTSLSLESFFFRSVVPHDAVAMISAASRAVSFAVL
jgi:hypothetical protein